MRVHLRSAGRRALLPCWTRGLFWALVLTIAIVGGCGRANGQPTTVEPLPTTDDPAAESAFMSAHGAESRGETVEARAGYEAFVVQYAADPLAPVAELRLARLDLAEGRAAEAKLRFEQLSTSTDPAIADRARLYLGVIAQSEGDPEGALALLRPLEGRTVAPEETGLLLTTIVQACGTLGDRPCAVWGLDALLVDPALLADADRATAEQSLVNLVAALGGEELASLYERLPRDGRAFPLVAARALRVAFAAGDLPRTSEIAREMRASSIPLDAELSAMAERAERVGRVSPQVIGAILPLSGRGREVGQRALEGATLAASLSDGGPPMQIIVRDSGADPEQAARAVDELVETHGVMAIIGPLDAAAASSAGARAAEHGVAMLALSPVASLVDAGPTVFQMLSSPSAEVYALVRRARAEGRSRFASFGPASGYGQAMQRALEEAVAALGGEVVGHTTYPVGATSIAREAHALARLRPDAILVPDRASQVALAAPALAAAGLPSETTARLLIPSVGADAAQLRASSRYLEGAYFSVTFDRSATMGPEAVFRAAYEARYGTTPDLYAAYAYDAVQLVRASVARGAHDRGTLIQGLLATGGQPTIGASRGFGPERRPAEASRLMQWRAGALTPLPAF